jgi:zinc protease
MEDLSAASEEDVKNFFRLYYAPNNAFLSIVGDFDPAQSKAWVTKYFGDIPRGNPITRPDAGPVTLSRRSGWCSRIACRLPRLYIQWPTVGEKNDDRFALSVLGAILSGPRTARLTKALVFDEQAAASVNAGQNTSEDVGEFLVSITPRPGHPLTDLELPRTPSSSG